MPDRKKFMQMKAQYDSLGQMMADYEKDFDGPDGPSNNPFDDQDADDAGQETVDDLMPELSITEDDAKSKANDNEDTKPKKSKSMTLASSYLRNKFRNKGY